MNCSINICRINEQKKEKHTFPWFSVRICDTLYHYWCGEWVKDVSAFIDGFVNLFTLTEPMSTHHGWEATLGKGSGIELYKVSQDKGNSSSQVGNIWPLRKAFHIISWILQQLGRASSIYPILEMKKLRFKEDRWFFQQSYCLKSGWSFTYTHVFWPQGLFHMWELLA